MNGNGGKCWGALLFRGSSDRTDSRKLDRFCLGGVLVVVV
jgi:hypothetical protein